MECIAEAKCIQDDDIALAKLLQEQERALYLVGRSNRAGHGEAEELTDEELARRLQEEEDQAAYEMAYAESAHMANLVPGVDADDGDGDAVAPSVDEPEQSTLPFSYEDMLALGDLAGKVSKGLKPEIISQLPVVRLCSLKGHADMVAIDRCCICQLELEEDEDITPLPCRHCYHTDCVRQWLQQSKACPVCGKELEPL